MKINVTLIFLLIANIAGAQQLVFDPAVVSTLVVNHTVQQTALKDIKENEAEIATAQKVIAVQMSYIKDLEQKMYNSLKNVSIVITGAKDIIYASQIAADIGTYQQQMVEIATGDPVLLAVAVKTEAALIKRTADLFTYIYTVAIIGGDFNLMNNKGRLDIIKNVVRELRVMRGLAYGVVRRMRVAKYAGVMKTLNPFGMRYPDNAAAIVQSLLDDFK